MPHKLHISEEITLITIKYQNDFTIISLRLEVITIR
jgi:hypothetical protein